MDVSIIVPCWDSADYIKNLLLSFHMLNLKDISYEIIFVVEDNTVDNTVDIINEYMFDMEYVILYNNGRTAGLARNKGMDFAHGEYIWFVDADDWIIYPEVLQITLKFLKTTNSNIIQLAFISNYFNKEHYSMVWQYIFKKHFIEDIPFNNKKYYEDNDFSSAVIAKLDSNNIDKLTIPSYFYNYNRPGSNTYLLRQKKEET